MSNNLLTHMVIWHALRVRWSPLFLQLHRTRRLRLRRLSPRARTMMVGYREEVELYVDLQLDGDEHRARKRGREATSVCSHGTSSALRTLYREILYRHISMSESSGPYAHLLSGTRRVYLVRPVEAESHAQSHGQRQ